MSILARTPNRFDNIFSNNYYAVLAEIDDLQTTNASIQNVSTPNATVGNVVSDSVSTGTLTTSLLHAESSVVLDSTVVNSCMVNQTVISTVIHEATVGTTLVSSGSLLNTTIGSALIGTALIGTAGVSNLSSGTLQTAYASIGSAVISNSTINSLSTSLTSISQPLVYTQGNLTIKHDYTLKLDNNGRLGTNDLTIVYEPLSQRNILDYASFLGISLDTVCTLLGLDPNNEFIQNYTILSLEYDDDYFYERNTLLGKKLALTLPDDKQVCFVDEDVSGKPF